jgi:hypothetical protein
VGEFAKYLRSLAISSRDSNSHELVYESEITLVFKIYK